MITPTPFKRLIPEIRRLGCAPEYATIKSLTLCGDDKRIFYWKLADAFARHYDLQAPGLEEDDDDASEGPRKASRTVARSPPSSPPSESQPSG